MISASRVAAATALIIAAVYGASIAVLDTMVARRLVAEVDARLGQRLADVGTTTAARRYAVADDDPESGAPVLLWAVSPAGTQLRQQRAPTLPPGLQLASGRPVSAHLGPATYRLLAAHRGGTLVVAGENLAVQDHTESTLFDGEALAAPVLLLAVFAGSLIIGLKALSPVEQSRRRQLEFTADASHELRTPLSVISAETDIALSGQRKPAEYQGALRRIDGESKRLRGIVEDLLWLARFDSRPPAPRSEPLDLATIAAECADRFSPVASARQLTISCEAGPGPASISAPPGWIDRLAGVLIDNACRYAGPGGRVRVSVAVRGTRACLQVEDSGPGIPPSERARLFDRFHRAAEHGGGAGLGLAIADSVVRSTSGRWRIGESVLGGALLEVSWRRSA
ncbi:MAG TPA: HAMP domain-containing sensor histidine kinase [Streptosporangiaceae bacterium]